MRSDSNYDTGAIYLEGDRWRIVAPTDPGPQPYNPGGEMVLCEGIELGASWRRRHTMTVGGARNHTYARRPVNAHDEFYAYWADGNPRRPSESRLYFCDRDGNVEESLDSHSVRADELVERRTFDVLHDDEMHGAGRSVVFLD